MLTKLFENKSEKPPVDRAPENAMLSRSLLQQSLDLVMFGLIHETDPTKLEAGYARIVDLQASLKRWDQIDAAAVLVAKAKRENRISEQRKGMAAMQQFSHNISMILNWMVRGHDHLDLVGAGADDRSMGGFHRRRQQYFQTLHGAISFEDAEKQVDEICNADRERRKANQVVNIPPVPGARRQMVNRFGEPA